MYVRVYTWCVYVQLPDSAGSCSSNFVASKFLGHPIRLLGLQTRSNALCVTAARYTSLGQQLGSDSPNNAMTLMMMMMMMIANALAKVVICSLTVYNTGLPSTGAAEVVDVTAGSVSGSLPAEGSLAKSTKVSKPRVPCRFFGTPGGEFSQSSVSILNSR